MLHKLTASSQSIENAFDIIMKTFVRDYAYSTRFGMKLQTFVNRYVHNTPTNKPELCLRLKHLNKEALEINE